MAIGNAPSIEEAKVVSRELFARFIKDHLITEGVPEDDINSVLRSIGARDGYRNPSFASLGRELRMIADDFARSDERKHVKNRALCVDVQNVTFEMFSDLLIALFPNGEITRERVVVLFFFCTDVALKAFTKSTLKFFELMVRWSSDFVINNICEWVQRNGGWGVVLGHYLPRLTFALFGALGSVAFYIYIKKNWN